MVFLSLVPLPYCLGVDSQHNKIYVANDDADTVSVIDCNSDTVKNTIPVGHQPTFILVTTHPTSAPTRISGSCSKIYVANSGDITVSVINGNNDTRENTKPVGAGYQIGSHHLTSRSLSLASTFFSVL